MFKKCDAVIAVSQSLAGCLPGREVTVIPNGIEPPAAVDPALAASLRVLCKKEFLVLGTEIEMVQMGQTFNTSVKMTEYKEVKGFKMAHKMITNAAGQNMVVEFTKVELGIPLDDSLFEIK